MRDFDAVDASDAPAQLPLLQSRAEELMSKLLQLSHNELCDFMKISEPMALKVAQVNTQWVSSGATLPAIDCFLGDIYSGLQPDSLQVSDRKYANERLFILSGLYGVLRALDGIRPYRLEMGYNIPNIGSLYSYWGSSIAASLPSAEVIINLSAEEYTRALLPYLTKTTIISPKFLTINPKTGEPRFVAVHAKIARGAFARWMIVNRIEDIHQLEAFAELGYRFNNELSTTLQPVFVAEAFLGTGMSIRKK